MEETKPTPQHTLASDQAPKLFTIPQLEWYDADDGRMRGHVNGRPLYRITARPESGVRWWRYEDGVDECRRVDTVETAKALCQLDFESQTASLLSPAGDALSRLAAAEQRVRDRDAELLRCRTHENVAAVTLDKTLNREQRDALKVAADLLATERQRVKELETACDVVGQRLVDVCAHGGTMQDFLDAGSTRELLSALAAATQDTNKE